jgi:hypothetical protein
MSESTTNEPIKTKDLGRNSCPSCKSERVQPVLLLSREGIPPGRPDHNIVYRHSVIVLCDVCRAGFLELHDHDCFDFEDVWNRDEWGEFDASSGEILRNHLNLCPAPLSENCECALHRSLRNVPIKISSTEFGDNGGQHIHPINIRLSDILPVFQTLSAK